MKTAILKTFDADILSAITFLQKGGLVAIPTETVYGLGADARNDMGVARIFEAKGRPSFNPLILHVDGVGMAEKLAVFSDQARVLASRFWPGPLTLVLPIRGGADVSALVTAGLDTLAIRMPAHLVALAVIKGLGAPVAAPSANLSGKVSPTCARHVLDDLWGKIDAVIDAGACEVGVESTIVGFHEEDNGAPILLRPGGINKEAIEAAIGGPLLHSGCKKEKRTLRHENRPSAPGQLSSHYAPSAALRLNVSQARPDEVWVGFGAMGEAAGLNLSKSGNLTEAATSLFDMLRQADQLAKHKAQKIAFAPIPEHGIGLAINDRLRRAAAPR